MGVSIMLLYRGSYIGSLDERKGVEGEKFWDLGQGRTFGVKVDFEVVKFRLQFCGVSSLHLEG